MILLKITLKIRQKEAVAAFSQELMHSLAYRPDLGSLSFPTIYDRFFKSSRNVICIVLKDKRVTIIVVKKNRALSHVASPSHLN